MRTTLTLDDDVAAAVEHRRRKLEHTLKQEINELIRVGLEHIEEPRSKLAPFRVEPLDAGGLLLDIDDTAALHEMLDAEDWQRAS